MVQVKNYGTMSSFDKVMPKIRRHFFPDTV